MTTRFASLVPLNGIVLRRERQQLKSKHLWDTIQLDWNALYDKLYVVKSTGLGRARLWELFSNKHRVNLRMEQEYQGSDHFAVRNAWKAAQWEISQYQTSSIPCYGPGGYPTRLYILAIIGPEETTVTMTSMGINQIRKTFFLRLAERAVKHCRSSRTCVV